jgi:hypothetical protein
MPAHIQPDFTIIDMPLGTARGFDCPSISRRACIATVCLIRPLRQTASCMQYYRDSPTWATPVAADLSSNSKPSERNEYHKPPSSKREVGETVLCTFESVKPIPGAFAAEKLATCETSMRHRQKKIPYHQSSIATICDQSNHA